MDIPTNSPIPWPTSDKRRKPNALTPDVRDASNKLSTKNSGKKSDLHTPTRSFSKWSKPSRSSLETFQRVYSEMTNSPTAKLSSYHNDQPNIIHGSVQCSNRVKENPPVTPFSTTNSKLKANVVVLDSDSDSSSSLKKRFDFANLFASNKKSTESSRPSSNQQKYLTDSSSDDDSFCLPPPLHQRVPFILTPTSLNKNTPPKKANVVGKAKGKENKSSFDKLPGKAIVIDDSSSGDDHLDVPVKGLHHQKSFKELQYGKTQVPDYKLPRNHGSKPSQAQATPKHIFEDSSSSSSFDYRLCDVSNTAPHVRNSKPKHLALNDSSSDYELPDIPNVWKEESQTPKTTSSTLPDTLPKSFKARRFLSNPRRKDKLEKSDTSSGSELPDLARTVPNKTKSNLRRIIFDSSSENELPDIPSEKEPSKPEFSNQVASKHSHPSTAPPGAPKLWTSPELLKESCRFLKSLSNDAPIEPFTSHFRKKFSKFKDELVQKLYKLFNESIFEEKLPPDMSVTWNIRLTKTAGYCYMRCHKDRTRAARIELSLKVLDSAERVRDTLLHEMCHAAAFIIHGYRDGHGPLFKFWGQKAGVLFPFLPVVSRCHTYSINTKYVYRCTLCKTSIGRHSKSLDMSRKVCGRCKGRFELLVNGVVQQQTSQKKTPEFAKFVKENYKAFKSANQNLKHADVMQKLGVMFADKAKV